MLKVFEAFAGIGAQRTALENLGIDHEVVAISEIDKYAIKSYEAIYGEINNLGDITKINLEDIPEHDLFTYSFPCQDISLAGKQKGLDKDSETRSSLLWECERIIEHCKPKYLLLENVKNLVGKKHKDNFNEWLNILDNLGYDNYWKVLKASDYGIAQKRERVFVVSIRKDLRQKFEWPKKQELKKILKDYLEDEVDEKYYLKNTKLFFIQNSFNNEDKGNGFRFAPHVKNNAKIANTITTRAGGRMDDNFIIDADCSEEKIVFEKKKKITFKIKNATKKGYLEAEDGDGIDLSYPDSTTRRGRVQKQCAHTLTTHDNIGVLDQCRIRKFTPLECWRLMGFNDESFYKAEKVNTNTQLYKQAGNSICVPVLEAIFKELFKGGIDNGSIVKNRKNGNSTDY